MSTKEELEGQVELQAEEIEALRARAEAAERKLADGSTTTGVRKAGANFRDKNSVVKMHVEGATPEVIGLTLSLREDHVEAIIKQYQDGTLNLSPRALSTKDGGYGVKQEEES